MGMCEFGEMLEDQIPRQRRYARALNRDPVEVDDLLEKTLVRAARTARDAISLIASF
jgi:DNA-directed RNA polymerase specialized sigma24 family protein